MEELYEQTEDTAMLLGLSRKTYNIILIPLIQLIALQSMQKPASAFYGKDRYFDCLYSD